MAYGDNVQTPQTVSGAGSSINVAYATTPTAGSTLVASGGALNGTQSISGSANSWTNKATQTLNDQASTQAYVLSCAGSAETVTFASAGFGSMVIAELVGPNASEITTTAAQLAGSTAVDTPAYSVTSTDLENGNILAMGNAGTNAASATFTHDAGWTELGDTAYLRTSVLGKRVVTATGNVAYGGDFSATGNWTARMVVLKQTAAAGGRRSRLAFLGAG